MIFLLHFLRVTALALAGQLDHFYKESVARAGYRFESEAELDRFITEHVVKVRHPTQPEVYQIYAYYRSPRQTLLGEFSDQLDINYIADKQGRISARARLGQEMNRRNSSLDGLSLG